MAVDVQKTLDNITNTADAGMSYLPTNQSTLDVQKAVDTTTPVQEVGMISSQQGLQEIKKADETLQTLEGDPEEKQAALDKIDAEVKTETTQPEKVETPTSTFVNEETGQEIKKTGELTKDEQDKLASQGYTLTDSTDTSSPELDKLKSEVKTAETEYNNAYKKLAETAIGSDELRGIVRSIKSSYGGRIARMERVNERRYKTLKTLGVRLGSRYSGGSGGVFGSILSEEERQGMARIDELEAEMESAINDAKMKAKENNRVAYTELIKEAENKREEKVKAFEELKKATEEADELAKEEETKLEQQANVIEQVNLGVTSPFEIFKQLNGEVPFDVIKEMTKELPDAEDIKLEFKTGSKYQPAGYFNPGTGEFVPLAGAAMVASGNSVAGTGGLGIQDFPTDKDLDKMSVDERDFVNKVMRQLPTKLKDSEQEKKDRMKEALFDYRRGRGIQEVVDELNGFVVADPKGQALANIFRSYAVGSGVELSEISASINNGNPEQAMTTIENAKLADADEFFGNIDQARNITTQGQKILSLLSGMDEKTINKLGSFDGRKFKLKRFTNTTTEEDLKIQTLATAMAALDAPLRLALAGTAVTAEEFARIEDIQTSIYDQPDITETKINELVSSALQFHNQARNQRGLPTVNRNQLVDNNARIKLYESKAAQAAEIQYQTYSNEDLFTSVPGTSSVEDTDNIWSTIGI